MDQNSEKIFVTTPSLPSLDEYVDELRGIWQSKWLTNNGSKHKQLEDELRTYLEVPYLSLFTNGHIALEALLRAVLFQGNAGSLYGAGTNAGGNAGPNAKTEVITTPYTFVSTANAISNCGLTPVFCDIRREDFTMCPEKAEWLVNERTAAILPVHVYGNICDVEAFAALGEKYGVPIIYDAAHAFGVRYKGTSAAALGDASMLSFHATKVFHSVEGGAAVVNRPELRKILGMLKNHGQNDEGEAELSGTNGKMSEFHAAMGLCNLRHMDEEIQKRKHVAELYRGILGNAKGLRLNRVPPEVQENFAYFPVIFEDGFGKTRDEVFDVLNRNGIVARKYFYPTVNEHSYYARLFHVHATPVAADASRRVLTLPMHSGVSFGDVERVCRLITG